MSHPPDSPRSGAEPRQLLTHPENNFDFCRIAAASMVLFSHQFAVLGRPEPVAIPRFTFGAVGVCIFFVISGFLVTLSWQRDPHAGRFALRRFLRIWPGLIAVTLLGALVLGPLVSDRPLADYFAEAQTRNYFKTLILNVKYALPGVFDHNPFPDLVNASLWTIPIEVRCYLVLLIAGVLGGLRVRSLVLASTLLLAAYHFGVFGAETNPQPNHFRELGLFFLYGACLQLYRDAWMAHRGACWVGAVLAAGLAAAFGHPLIALWVLLPWAVITFGLASTPCIRRFGRFGDLSYGIYIYAFPVQQLIAWWTGARFSVATTMVLSAALTIGLAFLSWHLVESPAMHWKPSRS